MRMVRGEHLINAVWARDKTTLWNASEEIDGAALSSEVGKLQ